MTNTAPHHQVDPARLLAQRWVRPEIQALQAYPVPSSAGLIKLDAMENPYGWPPERVGQWLESLRDLPLNRYPDPDPLPLKQALAAAMGVPDGAGLLLGNGSDELIQIIVMAMARPGAVLLAPEPSFVMYRMIARFVGMDYVGVPLTEDYRLDMGAMRAAIEARQPALIFLAYPNNPTGNLFAESDVVEILRASEGLVVVDEAYHPFAERSFMPRLAEFDNLLVMRTLSKMGLAGLRLGLVAGASAWIDEFNKLRLPYNINVLTQASARFALENGGIFAEQAAAIRADRQRLAQAMADLPGLRVYPSQANFLLFRVAAGKAPGIHAGLREAGVLIKNLDGSHPMLKDCLRVTVGTAAENQRFLSALQGLLER